MSFLGSYRNNMIPTVNSAIRNMNRFRTPSSGDSNDHKRRFYNTDHIICYVKNLVTGKVIEFELVPETFTDTVSASFEPQDIRGRSSPIQGYNNSGPRTISYTLTLQDDYCPGGILNTVNALKALTYPAYGGGLTPPTCYVRFGDMIKMKAIVGSVSVNWTAPHREEVFTKAEVSIDFTEIVDTPYSAFEIEGGIG